MKELSIEEKAKAYDELFVKAKQIYNKENDVLILHTVEDFFPELKESEDERIRKVLIDLVKCNERSGYTLLNNVTTDSMLAWLEKQGGKIDVIENFDTEFEKQVSCFIASAINKEHEYNQGYVKWAANALLNYAKHELEKQGEQNYDWGEEDESMREAIVEGLKAMQSSFHFISSVKLNSAIDWLKSLRPQNHWKPSDEQMEILLSEVNAWTKGCPKQKVLESLYNDLKKLMKE